MKTNPGKAAPPLAAIAIVIALSLGACSNPSSSNEDEGVSLSGVLCFGEQEDGSPCYWDGSTTAVPLGTIGQERSSVYSIARSGDLVVAAGEYFNKKAGNSEPCQWEGSEAYALPVGAEATGGSARCMAADSGAVYAAGYVATADGHIPALWKNREFETFALPAGMVGGEHTALAAQDGSLYRAGRYWDEEDVSSLFAVKDGGAELALALPDGADGGNVKDIAVSGSAVRYVGYYFLADGNSVPCMWDEKGSRTDLSLPSGLTRMWVSAAVFVGDELYIGGYGTNEDIATVSRVSLRSFDYCYWKNGAPAILEAPAGSSSESRLVDAQNAQGQAAFIGQISDSEGDSYYCAWVGGVPCVIARAYPQKG